MSLKEKDFEAVKDAVETLEENGFEVNCVDKASGHDAVDFDPESKNEVPLGRQTSIDLRITKEHY